MKVLILPDIHNRINEAQQIIDRENIENIVFLGDYFDSFNDTLEITQQTSYWLKDSMKDKNRIHLLGNHDLPYINPEFICSGYSEGKRWAINSTGVDLSKLKHYCYVEDWLCTHAGLSYDFYKAFATSGMNVNDLLETYSNDDELVQRLYQCSPMRGGHDGIPGIIWCDWDEFEPIPDQKQIFGHTHGDVRTKGYNICIDTWLHFYGIYEDGKMRIKANENTNLEKNY